jgi:hypothetical protein
MIYHLLLKKLIRKHLERDIYEKFPLAGKTFAETWAKRLAETFNKEKDNYRSVCQSTSYPPFYIEHPFGTGLDCYYRIDKINQYVLENKIQAVLLPISQFISYEEYARYPKNKMIRFHHYSNAVLPTESISPIYVLNCFYYDHIVIDGNHRLSALKNSDIESEPCIILQEDISINWYLNENSQLLAQFAKELSLISKRNNRHF